MNELTLESLAARVAALEKLLDIPPGTQVLVRNGHTFFIKPPTVAPETALAALDSVEHFDFEAVREREELELRIARETNEQWNRLNEQDRQP